VSTSLVLKAIGVALVGVVCSVGHSVTTWLALLWIVLSVGYSGLRGWCLAGELTLMFVVPSAVFGAAIGVIWRWSNANITTVDAVAAAAIALPVVDVCAIPVLGARLLKRRRGAATLTGLVLVMVIASTAGAYAGWDAAQGGRVALGPGMSDRDVLLFGPMVTLFTYHTIRAMLIWPWLLAMQGVAEQATVR